MSEETEKGKEVAYETFHRLLKNHRNKDKVERYFWKKDTYSFGLQVRGVDEPVYIDFPRALLDDCAHPHNASRRDYLQEKILAALDSLS